MKNNHFYKISKVFSILLQEFIICDSYNLPDSHFREYDTVFTLFMKDPPTKTVKSKLQLLLRFLTSEFSAQDLPVADLNAEPIRFHPDANLLPDQSAHAGAVDLFPRMLRYFSRTSEISVSKSSRGSPYPVLKTIL